VLALPGSGPATQLEALPAHYAGVRKTPFHAGLRTQATFPASHPRHNDRTERSRFGITVQAFEVMETVDRESLSLT